jgi:hypothetical protein
MTARRAHESPGWVGLQPTLALAPVPDSVFRTEHPPPPLAVKHRQVADGDPKGPRLETPDTAFLDEVPVAELGLCEWIDSHLQSIAPHMS